MLLFALVRTAQQVAATRSRLAKRVELVERLSTAEPGEIEIVVAYLAGEVRQRRTGIGWAALRALPEPAAAPSLTLVAVDDALQQISELAGPGSAAARTAAVRELFGAATEVEQDFLRRLISGAIRQGALDSAVLDALAVVAEIPLADIRRAVMLAGATGPVAFAALTGGAAALAGFGLQVGRPIRPMLASTEPDVAAALTRIAGPAVVDTKLDGIRIQAHRADGHVRLFTRSLDDVTHRLDAVVGLVAGLPGGDLVLDGEVIAVDASGRPRPFQETASRTATEPGMIPAPADVPADNRLTAYFFDVLAAEREPLIDRPLADRLDRLADIVPAEHRIEGVRVDGPPTDRGMPDAGTADGVAAAQDFFTAALEKGHEGVVVKALDAPYQAGRRGTGWIKVKPRHTLDLVVLAVEWGSGRRRGFLSNIHLGARDPDGGGFVMLGKTFKGMTDDMLAWQTERFPQLADGSTDGWVVRLRPEQVVEIAFDGLQRSSRYPGGLALRFARVVRYRTDKRAEQADTIEAVRALSVD